MANYKTPGVYVEEITKLPASVAQVETAIPAFIGYTSIAEKNGRSLVLKPTRISSLLEYNELFGGAPEPKQIFVDLDSNNGVTSVDIQPNFYLYDSVRMFFANGGGNCYIVSVAEGFPASVDDIDKDELLDGLTELKKEDEPTLIVIPDAVSLSVSDLSTVQQAVLEQCNKLQDRFGIFDVQNDEENGIQNFRDNIGINYLKYGAAYYPFIKTTLKFDYGYSNIILTRDNDTENPISLANISSDPTIVNQLDKVLADQQDIVEDFIDKPYEVFLTPFDDSPYEVSIKEGYALIPKSSDKDELKLRAKYIMNMLKNFVALTGFTDTDASDDIDDKTVSELFADAISAGTSEEFSTIKKLIQSLTLYDLAYSTDGGTTKTPLAIVTPASDFTGYAISALAPDNDLVLEVYGPKPTSAAVTTVVNHARPYFNALYEDVLSLIVSFYEKVAARGQNLEKLLELSNPTYKNILKAIKNEGIILPPSGAIAGVYAAVDSTRGVWKAPANVSLSAVIGPVVKINDDQQADMNVDVNAGKSINAIRSFAGKGTIVWGARTLAGNDNEWRYIPVRRLYNMVEESVKKSTSWVVFEPNDANTWIRVKAQIENFLTKLWRDGALAGATPEDAFFVQVGIGVTMTAQDILEGRLNIEIGMAAVRPAEFIILKFSHLLQKS